jgi:hypothetical protein
MGKSIRDPRDIFIAPHSEIAYAHASVQFLLSNAQSYGKVPLGPVTRALCQRYERLAASHRIGNPVPRHEGAMEEEDPRQPWRVQYTDSWCLDVNWKPVATPPSLQGWRAETWAAYERRYGPNAREMAFQLSRLISTHGLSPTLFTSPLIERLLRDYA